MADEMFDADDDVVGAEETQGGQRRVGFLSGVLIQILKWVGIILGAIIFIVTVVVVTVNFLGRGNASQTRVPESELYRESVPILEWYEQIAEALTTMCGQRTSWSRRSATMATTTTSQLS